MRFSFHPEAESEFDKTAEYYEQCQPGLGLEFAEEVYATIVRIIEYPNAWSVLSKNTCRCLTNRFPYGLIYQVKTNTLRIIAVANLHQCPGFWKENRAEESYGGRREIVCCTRYFSHRCVNPGMEESRTRV